MKSWTCGALSLARRAQASGKCKGAFKELMKVLWGHPGFLMLITLL